MNPEIKAVCQEIKSNLQRVPNVLLQGINRFKLQLACGGAFLVTACAPQPTSEQTQKLQEPPKPKDAIALQVTNTPEPKQDPTAAPTKEPTREPTAAPKPPETESPFPVYGVFEGEYRSGKQTSYVVVTTPLDERVGGVMTYLHGLMDCSGGKINYAPGTIVAGRESFLKPGFKRGQFRDSFKISYDPRSQSISGELIVPPHPEIKACDAEFKPFEARLVGYGPETFVQAYIRSYAKAGLFTDATRATRAKEDIAKYIGELPPPPSK